MSYSAKTLAAFGVYVVGLGVILIFSPNKLLKFFGMALTEEVWIRVLGVVLSIIGYYYIQTARAGLTQFFMWTVQARASVIFFFTMFVLRGLASPTLILFGLVDFAAAMWTYYALQSEQNN
jgi:hypothetical protein